MKKTKKYNLFRKYYKSKKHHKTRKLKGGVDTPSLRRSSRSCAQKKKSYNENQAMLEAYDTAIKESQQKQIEEEKLRRERAQSKTKNNSNKKPKPSEEIETNLQVEFDEDNSEDNTKIKVVINDKYEDDSLKILPTKYTFRDFIAWGIMSQIKIDIVNYLNGKDILDSELKITPENVPKKKVEFKESIYNTTEYKEIFGKSGKSLKSEIVKYYLESYITKQLKKIHVSPINIFIELNNKFDEIAMKRILSTKNYGDLHNFINNMFKEFKIKLFEKYKPNPIELIIEYNTFKQFVIFYSEKDHINTKILNRLNKLYENISKNIRVYGEFDDYNENVAKYETLQKKIPIEKEFTEDDLNKVLNPLTDKDILSLLDSNELSNYIDDDLCIDFTKMNIKPGNRDYERINQRRHDSRHRELQSRSRSRSRSKSSSSTRKSSSK